MTLKALLVGRPSETSEFADTLSNTFGVPEANIKILENATKQEILDEFNSLIMVQKPGDCDIVYISGDKKVREGDDD